MHPERMCRPKVVQRPKQLGNNPRTTLVLGCTGWWYMLHVGSDGTGTFAG